MKLKTKDITKLENFITKLQNDVYPERLSLNHFVITKKIFYHFTNKYTLPPKSKVLDVGCGQGPAFALFEQQQWDITGITLGDEDLETCQQKGYNVHKMDQSFLEFPDETFDFLWCRHCLEHSPFPLFTLQGFFRVLKKGGYLYLEMPAPDTFLKHHTNKNHYSILPKSSWSMLIIRSGFKLLESMTINHPLPVGIIDTYLSFIASK